MDIKKLKEQAVEEKRIADARLAMYDLLELNPELTNEEIFKNAIKKVQPTIPEIVVSNSGLKVYNYPKDIKQFLSIADQNMTITQLIYKVLYENHNEFLSTNSINEIVKKRTKVENDQTVATTLGLKYKKGEGILRTGDQRNYQYKIKPGYIFKGNIKKTKFDLLESLDKLFKEDMNLNDSLTIEQIKELIVPKELISTINNSEITQHLSKYLGTFLKTTSTKPLTYLMIKKFRN